jgi:BCD family chlorophyll transporter-like MFS transporter
MAGGLAAGGALRDITLSITGQVSLAYASVFFIEGLGLLLCIALLMRVDISGFAAAYERQARSAEMIAPNLD